MKDLIEIAKGFQTSVNIAYDLRYDDKVREFIPTMSSLEIIEDVLLSTVTTSTSRARILIGAYGRGKSHIVLVLMAMLFKKGRDIDKTLFSALLEKMNEHNPDFGKFAKEYIDSTKMVFPIVVRGSGTSLTQSFLGALQQALNEENLSDLMPDTHFKAVVSQIERWRDDYHDTYERLTEILSKSVSDFVLSLYEFSVEAYNEFIRVYPILTSGGAFNPFIGFDVVELYADITAKLKEKGYSGVYVIYDEFSKYLESSIALAPISDIKLLQDFAERCNRSGENQMHLMLISHKDVANYIDGNLPKDKVDGWRGVSGRFKHVYLHNNYSQIYDIISIVLRKSPQKWHDFLDANEHLFDDLKGRFKKNGLLDSHNPKELDTVVVGCFPLHPISTFILPRLSEKVAQNERTLFTFLSADDRHTLTSFIQMAEEGFSLLTPEYIYDYFEPLFRKEPYTSEVHKIYKLTANVLRRVENKPLHERIIKIIALIYLVEQFEKLPPTIDMIVDALRDTVNSTREIDFALKDLVDNDCVVYIKRSNNYLKIKETSGVDIGEEISRFRERNLANTRITTILNDSAFDSFLYPTRYNDRFDIIRYFGFLFIDSKDFWDVDDWGLRISNIKADGVVFAVVPKSHEEIEVLQRAVLGVEHANNRIVFILPRKYIDIANDALDFAAVTSLMEKAAEGDDDILSDEYAIYVEDLAEVVGSYISSYTRPENASSTYYYLGREQPLKRRAHLSSLLSTICEGIFSRTPVINNEQVNKNHLPTNTINSRTKVLAGLLANELSPNLGLSGTGQDVSIMRSTLLKTEVLINADTTPTIQLLTPDERMSDMLSEIRAFFTESAAQQTGECFLVLYDILTLHENGFGMKLGVIPIYIAAVLQLYKKNLVILYRGSEVKITPELLNDINEKPQDYSAVLEDWNEEKTRYMRRLECIFSEFVAEREKSFNSFTYMFYAMNRWYLSLPKFAKDAKHTYLRDNEPQKIQASHKKFVESFKRHDVNPREFLFEKTFSIFRFEGFTENVVENIESVKDEYDNLINGIVDYLIGKVKMIFSSGKSMGSLSSVIKDWYDDLNDRTRQNLFRGNENKILELISTINNDDKLFIQRLAKAVTLLRIDDWNSDTVDAFISDLEMFKASVESFNAKDYGSDERTASYEIIVTDAYGNSVPKRFDKTAYSDKARLLLNEMASYLDEYGQSITEQEKRQVLIELLETLC